MPLNVYCGGNIIKSWHYKAVKLLPWDPTISLVLWCGKKKLCVNALALQGVLKNIVDCSGGDVENKFAGFIFEHLPRDPRFDNVTRRPGYSRGPSGFLPVAIEGMSFSI